DQLTDRRYAVDIARNFLKTITPVIEKDRTRISLSDGALDGILAYGHAWLGRHLLVAGQAAEARSHLRRSLGFQWDFGRFLLYGLSFLPGGSVGAMHRRLGGIRQRLIRAFNGDATFPERAQRGTRLEA